jgi:hypothetical protein
MDSLFKVKIVAVIMSDKNFAISTDKNGRQGFSSKDRFGRILHELSRLSISDLEIPPGI